MRLTRALAALLFTMALSGMVAAQTNALAKGQPASTTTNVTSIINDFDSGIAPALRIQSDGAGRYTSSSALQSEIYAGGGVNGGIWEVSDYGLRGATRTVYLSFSQPIAGTGPNGGAPVSPPSGYYVARVIAECYHFGGNSFLTIAPGATMSCPLNVHFDYGGKTYDLHQAPLNATSPETNSINVTCIYPTTGTSACSQWHLWPSATYTAPDGTTKYRNVANLSYEVQVKGNLTYVKQGDFYVSFSIVVTNP